MAISGKTLGFDIDDVIADFWDIGIQIFNRKYGASASKADFVTFEAMNEIYNIDYPEFYKTIIEEGLLEQMKPYSNVPEIMQDIYSRGHEIVLITSRSFHPDSYNVTKAFLDRNEIPFHKLHIKENGKSKADYIEKGMYSFVDDLPANLHDVKASNKVKNLVLIDQPWNRDNNDFVRYSALDHFHKKHLEKRIIQDLSL